MAETGITGFNSGIAIVPDDSVSFPSGPSSAIYIGTGGDLNVQFANGAVILKSVPSGTVLPLKIVRVNAQNTTATDLVKFNYV